jgi:alkylation response protein AidB-like acyl-CoA dehydrogenase
VDFGYHYTEEQQRFRQEVKTWLDDNIPGELRDGWLPQDQEPAALESCLAFRKLLGDKGWLAPAEPAAQGGGGLTDAHEIVLLEELEDRRLRWFLETPSQSLKQALLPWIDQPHTGQLLTAINTGSVLLWYPWLEQVKELEPGSIGIRALRDGDDYILSGEGLFTGQGRRPDYLWVLALAGPESAPEETTAAFLVPGELDGIAVQTNRTLAPGQAMAVRFDQTRVPAYCLLGNDGDGWLLTRSAFLEEPATRHPRLQAHDLESLLQFAKEHLREGVPLLDHPVLQQLLMEAHIESRINHLFRMRDAWMRSTGQDLTYQAAQTALLESRAAQRLSEISRDVMGAYALLDRRDPRAPSAGTLELQQRMSLVHQSQDSGVEGYAAAIAQHLGMGITQDLSQTPSKEKSPAMNHPGAATGKPEQADVSSDGSSAGPLPQK